MPFLQPRVQKTALDGSGNGQVTFTIDNTNQRWVVDALAVMTDQAANTTPVPRADIYLNAVDNEHWRGGTDNGSRDMASGRVVMYPGDTVYVVWSGGIAHSNATALLDGTFDPAGVPIKDS